VQARDRCATAPSPGGPPHWPLVARRQPPDTMRLGARFGALGTLVAGFRTVATSLIYWKLRAACHTPAVSIWMKVAAALSWHATGTSPPSTL